MSQNALNLTYKNPPIGKVLSAWDWSGVIRVQHKLNGRSRRDSIYNEWYFCIKLSDYMKLNGDDLEQYRLTGVIKGAYVHKGTDFVRIYMDWDKKQIMEKYLKYEGVPTYEADLSMYKRWMVDTNVQIETAPTCLFF